MVCWTVRKSRLQKAAAEGRHEQQNLVLCIRDKEETNAGIIL